MAVLSGRYLFLCFEGWQAEIRGHRVGFWRELSAGLMDSSLLLCPHMTQPASSLVSLLKRALNPRWGPHPHGLSQPEHIPNTPPPNPFTLGIGASTQEFGETLSTHKRQKKFTQGRSRVMTEAEVGMVCLQVKKCQGTPANARS